MNPFILSLLVLLSVNFQDETTRILFYGDSITAGYGLDIEQAFPAIIENQLIKTGHNVKVTNAGLSGETSAGGLNRINWILKNPVDIFVLELGANDGLRGLPLYQTRENLQKIIDIVKKKNPDVKIIIAGMMVPPNMGEEYTTEFKKIYPDLASRNNAVLIPFLLDKVAGIENLNLGDRIHPNEEGHKIVAGTVISKIKPLL